MSGKSKHGRPDVPSGPSQRAEWIVFAVGREVPVPLSSLHLSLDGHRQFRDDAGVVADFPAGTVTGVIRKPPRELVRVPLPARFVTTPASVRELQEALTAALGVQVILEPAGSKAADAVWEPE